MKNKFLILALVVVFAFGALGIGYAHWSQTLYIEGTVKSGLFKVGFTRIVAEWDSEDWCDYWTAEGAPIPYPCKDVGDAWCTLSCPNDEGKYRVYDKLTMTVNNTYPCYWAINKFTIDNPGTIPAHCTGLKMIPGAGLKISAVMRDVNGRLIGWVLDDSVTGKPILNVMLYKEPPDYGPGWEIDPPTMFPDPWPHSLICNQVDPCDELLTELWVHCKQDAKKGWTYTFDIEVEYTQWNQID
jgi:hypothetical protein